MKSAPSQGYLWGTESVGASARTSDPVTSHEAASRHNESGATESNKARILRFVKANPGLTSAEIAKRMGMDRVEVARRLPNLVDDGEVEQRAKRACTVGRGEAVTWWAV